MGSGNSSQRIELHGEYDLSRRKELAELFGAIERGGPDIRIDLRNVSYVDSSFINELASLRLRLDGRRIILVNPQPQLRRLFSILAFDKILQIIEEK